MSTLISQGGFGCIYYPGLKCSGDKSNDKEYVSKLQKKDFNAMNEIYIGNLIKEIPFYKNYFIPVVSSCPIDLRKIDSKLVSDCNVIARSSTTNYILMNLDYIENISLEKTILTSESTQIKKKTFSQILSMYSYLLNGFEKLLEKNIIQFDFKQENLLFNLQTDIPMIIDFGISIPKDKLTADNMKKYFYGYAPEYYIWPLEVHVINFLLHIKEEPLTDDDAILIGESYAKSNIIRNFFSEEFNAQFTAGCVRQVKKYVGIPKQKLIDKLISYYKTWDNYSISIMFIGILQKIFKRGFHFNAMIILFTQLLVINFSPNPENRLEIGKSRDAYENIFYSEPSHKRYNDLLSDLG